MHIDGTEAMDDLFSLVRDPRVIGASGMAPDITPQGPSGSTSPVPDASLAIQAATL